MNLIYIDEQYQQSLAYVVMFRVRKLPFGLEFPSIQEGKEEGISNLWLVTLSVQVHSGQVPHRAENKTFSITLKEHQQKEMQQEGKLLSPLPDCFLDCFKE